tara:strand:+ start:45 stop:563 length:519 start_codon:yes stop_codon:yes gene_type:complete
MDEPDVVCIGDLGVSWQEQQARMADLMSYLMSETTTAVQTHLEDSAPGHSDRGDGGALLYLIESPDGSVLFQDTSGRYDGILGRIRPDVAILAAAGRGNIDGEPIQGSLAEFVAQQVELLNPQKVVFGHHDDWLPGFSIPVNTGPIVEEIRKANQTVEILEPGYLEATEILP